MNSDTGITQLVGRILRQPEAKKTSVRELDESYVYYSKGETHSLLEKVDMGFRNEGLEDLMNKVKLQNKEDFNETKKVKIRKEFRKKFESAFYLPVWVMIMEGKSKRRFSYEMDVKPYINFSSFIISDEMILKLSESLSAETKERHSIIVTLDAQSKFKSADETTMVETHNEINIDYLTRRYSELIENSFLARRIAEKHLENVISGIGLEKTCEHFSFVSSFLFQRLNEEKRTIEERIFLNHLNQKKLVLAVSNDIKDASSVGFRIPDEDMLSVGRMPNPYKYYLFEDVDLTVMNTLERKVGEILDKQEKIIWWFRNKISNQWYSIQGWQEYKLRPDFVAAKKKDNGELELVYILESKGEHLLGNADTQYKQKVLNIMTEQKNQNSIHHYEQLELPFGKVNDNVGFYLVEQGKEEEDLRRFFK